MSQILEVWLADMQVGMLQLLAGDRSFFAFTTEYLNTSLRPVLSQAFFKPSGELIAETKISQAKLPSFFSNLLPEGHLRRYLAERGGINPQREFVLLQLLGQDLAGAVIVCSPEETLIYSDDVEKLNQPYKKQPLRFSLAGVQLKFSAILQSNGGLTIPTSGVGGDWIVKLPSMNFSHVPENEWAMLHLASEIGIPVPETYLLPLNKIDGLPDVGLLADNIALAVKRFDRGEQGKRIHIEDFAQVFNVYPSNKYGRVSYNNIAHMIWTLTGEEGITDFIRRLVFTIIIGNGDMHLKNWSFIYRDHYTPMLAPAYDFVSTIPYLPDDNLALTLSDSKDMKAITLQHFSKLAKKANIPEHIVLQTVQESKDKIFSAWAQHHKNYALPKEILIRIQKHMAALSL